MELVQYTVKLDLTDNGCFDTGWRIKQGDSGSSQISAIIVNNDEPVISALNPPRIVFKRPDGKSIVGNMTLSGSRYFYTFVGNELAIAGPVIMDVKFEDESGRVSTASCKFTCVEDTLGYDPSGSSTYSNPVSTLIEVAEERAVDSEAWAVGKRNGVDVGPGDETYHNNAKYWSQQSKGGGGGGSVVEWNQIRTSGDKIAQITIDGQTTDVFATSEGGTGGVTKLSELDDVLIKAELYHGESIAYNASKEKWENRRLTEENILVQSPLYDYDGTGTLYDCLIKVFGHIRQLDYQMSHSNDVIEEDLYGTE